MIWSGSDDGKLYVTIDGGAQWMDLSKKLKGLPEGSWIPQIRASDYEEGTAWIVANDYRRNNWSAYLYKVEDFGKKVTRIVDDSDVFGPVLSVLQDPVEPNLLWVGGEYGLYVSLNQGNSFQKWEENMPTVQVMDLAFQKREKDLVLGTFGRGAWVLDDIEPLRELAASTDFEELTFFTPPVAYQWERKQSPGVRFAASATFRGENRSFGARFKAFVPQVAEDNKKKMRVDYQDSNGDTIYTQFVRVKEGLNSWRWAMWQSGERYPEFKIRKEKKDQSDPRGASVLPGTYKVTISFSDKITSQEVEVREDPRMKEWVSMEDLVSRQEAYKGIQSIQSELDEAVQKLARANQNIESLQKVLKTASYKNDSILADTVKATAKALEEVRHGIFGKKETKGYFEQPETWSNQWGASLWQLASSKRAWESNEQNLFNHLKNRTEEATKSVNNFLDKDYKALMDYLESNPVNYLIPLEE